MVEFETAYKFLIKYEGGYSNNSVDVGGETYKGISRRYNKTWPGWAIIDSVKNEVNFPLNLSNSIILETLVKKFYRERYWDTLLLDEFGNQDLANELFDISVNLGIHRAVIFLQIALNLLNRNERLYDDLVEDGIVGVKTIGALKEYFKSNDSELLIKVINILQGNHYIEFMRKSSKQEIFARGWFSRINFMKR